MKIVIVKETNTVGKDGVFYDNLDLSSCGLPNNLWALQWYDNNTGHIEYDSPMIQNDEITELPAWATASIDVWQVAEDAKQAEIAAQQAAQQAANEQALAEQAGS